jgi:threonine/homoserine/homoserine lactone efflux protein
VASAILIVIPGPSVLFTVGRALAYGRRTALATVCGNVAGNYLVAACVAFGLGSLVQRSAQVFLAVKLAGALYLIWLGVQAIRHRATLAEAFSAGAPGPRRRPRRARGLHGRGDQPQGVHPVRRGAAAVRGPHGG